MRQTGKKHADILIILIAGSKVMSDILIAAVIIIPVVFFQ